MFEPTYSKLLLTFVLVFLIIFLTLRLVFKPSHDRSWELGHEALPYIQFNNDIVTISNYRNFAWTGPFAAEPFYQTRTFNANDITGVNVLIAHFSKHEGMAHIFLGFEIKNADPVLISLETRREEGETFSPFLGLFRQFEIIYVVGDYQDLVRVRTNYRNERVYQYPTKATSKQAKQLFGLLAEDINTISHNPRMYNTLFRNCTNEITRRVEEMSEVTFPITWKTILPGYYDEVLYEMNILDTSLSFEELKKQHLISPLK